MLHRPDGGTLTLYFEGRAIPARDGDSVAAALLASGIQSIRDTTISGSPRGPYCMMGACFECLAVIDDRSGTQACMVQVRDGMRVERQHGPREV